MRKGQMREPRRNLPLLATSGLRLFRASLRGLGISKASFCCVGPLIAIPFGVFHRVPSHPRPLSFTDIFRRSCRAFFPSPSSPAPWAFLSEIRPFPTTKNRTRRTRMSILREGDSIRVLTLPSVSGTCHPACHTTTGVPV